mmetsp:Transcript_1076/g.1986  ORF Transcript_1076/g.1986 Transcript_1076/m.1986 type:complete len:162 (-) Transcript_1076:107-592(-)
MGGTYAQDSNKFQNRQMRAAEPAPQQLSQSFQRAGQESSFTKNQFMPNQNQYPVQSPQRISQHQEFFISELESEIKELRHRQRDYNALKNQFRYLQDQYKQVQIEKQRIESDCLHKIGEDRIEIDRLIRELDMLKNENVGAEQEQERIIDMIAQAEKEVAG